MGGRSVQATNNRDISPSESIDGYVKNGFESLFHVEAMNKEQKIGDEDAMLGIKMPHGPDRSTLHQVTILILCT